MTFDDEFNSLNWYNGSSGTWQPNFFWASNGGVAGGESSWEVNPNYGPTSGANPYSVSNGVLTLSVLPTPSYEAASVDYAPFLGAQIQTRPTFSQTYGYFEMNAELSGTPGTLSGFWLLPESGAWPPELDIEEVVGNSPTTLVNSSHSSTAGNNDTYETVTNTSQSFNTYAIDWEPNTITWYFNGQVVKQEATPSDMHQPMYMVADIFAGNSGSWEGQPSSGATASMKINYIHVYNSDPYTSGGSTATTTTAATTPSTPAATTPTTTAGPTTGSGSDSLVLSMSEDAYQGDAQFTVSVDGQQQGGTFTVTASHAAGSTETFTFDGNWAPGAHTVTVNFLNDAYGGSSSADRNLYVNAVNYDGANTGQSLTLFGDGPQSLTVQDSTATSSASSGSAASGSPAPATTAIASTEASLTVSGTGGSFTASAGDHLIFITGSDNSFNLSGGAETIDDTGAGNNTFHLPAAGDGTASFNTILTGDVFDLTKPLAGTSWDGATASLASYLHTQQSGANTQLLLSTAASTQASGTLLATFDNSSLSLSEILAHATV
jgi:beta-glucanase (GH16 family)